jgi:ABC-type branched-subunit amino acid transport system substrate-binding protein
MTTADPAAARKAVGLLAIIVAIGVAGSARGGSADGPSVYLGRAEGVTASLGQGVRVSADVVPCASCHGADGRGRDEGGVSAPDIRWSTLTKPYAVTLANGRRRDAYTQRSLKRAVALGIDSSGNRLLSVMPRYSMKEEQFRFLMKELDALDHGSAPGVDDSSIRIGIVLPPKSSLTTLSSAQHTLIANYFDEVNRSGGVYGRRIEPQFWELSGTPEERAAALRKTLGEQQVLAIAAAFTDGAEDALAKVADEQQIPLLASMTPNPANSAARRPWVRDLYAGVTEQVRALARYAAQRFRDEDVVVVDDRQSPMTDAALAELHAAGVAASVSLTWPKSADVILFCGSEGLLRQALQDGGRQTILLPGSVAGPATLTGTSHRVFVALPVSPQDLTKEGRAVWERLSKPSRSYSGSHLSALASVKVLVEALGRAGRELTRESLVKAIDGIRDFQTGVSPALTFGPQRHIGSTGAYIFEATGTDPQPVWIDPG